MSEPEDTLGVASTMHALEFGQAKTQAADPIANASTLAASAEETAATAASASSAVSRYRRVESLGVGGMGVVERVWDNDLMRNLAVKRLRPELRSNSSHLDQFLWEARVGAHLDHPNIVPVHDLGVNAEGDVFFTMKHVEGTTFAELIESLQGADGPDLPLPSRLRLYLQLCNAVDFAHAKGVVHRDLKPANVMLGGHGELFVMDWGIARPCGGSDNSWMRDSFPKTLRHGLSGTPQYMSPEQARGLEVGPSSDIYALGVILYELTSLRCPIEGETIEEVLSHVKAGDYVPLREAMPAVSASLAAVVERAMALEPANRYARGSDLAKDIERVLDGRTPEAETTSLAKRFQRYWTTEDQARLRPMDLDFLILSGIISGIALGSWVASAVSGWEWALLIAAGVIGLPPLVQWFRTTGKSRPLGDFRGD